MEFTIKLTESNASDLITIGYICAGAFLLWVVLGWVDTYLSYRLAKKKLTTNTIERER